MLLAQLCLPLAAHYPDWIAHELSQRLHRPVRLAAVHSAWQVSAPKLLVTDLTLGPRTPGGPAITLQRAVITLHFGALLRPGQPWVTLTAENQVVGYDIATGIPVEQARFDTVRQPDTVAVDTAGGALLIGSATGDGLQRIPLAG